MGDGGAVADGSGFHEAPALDGAALVKKAKKNGGSLYYETLEEIGRFLTSREGASIEDGDAGKAVAYLQCIFHGVHSPESVGTRTTMELRTIAECMDALSQGNLPRLGDLLAQHFKSLQMYVQDKSWAVARRVQLVPDPRVGLIGTEERRQACKEELLNMRLDEALEKAKKKSG